MNWYKQALGEPMQEQPQRQEETLQEPPMNEQPNIEAKNPLDGMSTSQAKKILNNKVIPHEQIQGFFSDDSWQGIQQVWNAFNTAGIDWGITGSDYSNDQGVPNGRTWQVEVNFTDRKGKPSKVYGVVRASGAGSVEDPLDRYDIVSYFL